MKVLSWTVMQECKRDSFGIKSYFCLKNVCLSQLFMTSFVQLKQL